MLTSTMTMTQTTSAGFTTSQIPSGGFLSPRLVRGIVALSTRSMTTHASYECELSTANFTIPFTAAETPGLIEESFTCVKAVDLDIDPVTSCSDYVEVEDEPGVMTRSCICEGDLCAVPDYRNGKKRSTHTSKMGNESFQIRITPH